MQTTLYSMTVPVFAATLRSLHGILDKAARHCEAHKIDEAALLQARIFPDMFPLVRQIQIASDNAKGSTARLAGITPPKMEDNETSFAQLRTRLEKTIEFIESVPADKIAGGEDRLIPMPYYDGKVVACAEFAAKYALPNFFFHVVTAYALLRGSGVPLGKADFISNIALQDAH